jgi:uncharacterized protein YjbJ (UPF0337 family)
VLVDVKNSQENAARKNGHLATKSHVSLLRGP